MEELLKTLATGFSAAITEQAPIVVGIVVAALLAAVGKTIALTKKLGKTLAAIAEAKLEVMAAEAEKERIAALAAVRIVEAKTAPAIRVASDMKKEMAISQAEDLLGKAVEHMPDAVEAAHAAEKRLSAAPEDVTAPEMPSVKLHGVPKP
jgi:hypothetical protein